MSRRSALAGGALGGAVLLTATLVRLWMLGDAPFVTGTHGPVTIMGTRCTFTAVAANGLLTRSNTSHGMSDAEESLQAAEAWMSVYRENSDLSRVNAAPPGQAVPVRAELMAGLRVAKDVYGRTGGAFDVTYLPVFRLWEQAGKAGRTPTAEELAAAKALCGWDKWELLEGAARKSAAGAGIGLGGLKGWAVARAAQAMRRAGCAGGLVNAGGDIGCFGPSPRGGKWRIAIRDPFHPDEDSYFGTLELTDACVFTSGNYERYVEIGGKRYSHIIDPRTAMPAEMVASVTVIGPSADEAVGWSTALSVLGKEGLSLLKAHPGIEAMLVQGGPDDYTIHQTPGFAQYLAEPIPPAPGKGAGK
jgi:FAD:protein FMN transferase